MKLVFADTGFYIAFVNPRDLLHARSQDFSRRFAGRLLPTEYVLIELGNFLSRSGDRELFVGLTQSLRSDPNTIIVPGDHVLYEQGVNLYAKRMDKEWSLTDCISFFVMGQHGISDAATGDHHFEQAGFKVLLK